MAWCNRGWMLAALCCLAVTVAAQETRREQVQERTQQQDRANRTGPTANAELDQFIRHCVALGNRNEIQLAEFAQQKSQEPAVQQFTQRMIEDHGKFLKRVSGNTADARHETPADGNTRREPGQDNVPPRRDGAPASARDGRQDNNVAWGQLNGPYRTLAMIDDEIAHKCLQTAQEELGSKQGAEFEKCFFGMQLFMHKGMIDKLQVLQEHASPELAQVLQEGLQTSQEHAQLAQQMLDQATAQTARKPATTRQD